MVTLSKIPKDALEFHARDLDDYMKARETWIRNGMYISDDITDGLSVTVALKDAKILLLFYEAPGTVRESEVETQEESEYGELSDQVLEKREIENTTAV